ncbi:MAG: hypothetical protein AAF216_04950 [Pseudomonadota bacterium]
MNALVFAFAGICLIAVHLLRAPAGGRRVGAVLAFILGLAITATGVRFAVSEAGIGRTTDFDRVVNHAVAEADAANSPLIVFTGASYSRNAIDPERFTKYLRAHGYPHTAINLSLEAASLPEREAHLEDFITRLERPPELVFAEVAEAFDARPAQFFNNSKFSARGIEQFGPRTSAWTLLGLAEGGCSGMADCIKSAGLTGAHFGLNALNIGSVARGEAPSETGELAAYDPQTQPREETAAKDRLNGLRSGPDYVPTVGLKWISSLRAMFENRLERKGVATIGYYFPPVIDGGARAYVDGLCLAELVHTTCISPSDPELLAALEGEVWLDQSHLLASGANIYSDWLADQIIVSGALGAPAGSDFAEDASAP